MKPLVLICSMLLLLCADDEYAIIKSSDGKYPRCQKDGVEYTLPFNTLVQVTQWDDVFTRGNKPSKFQSGKVETNEIIIRNGPLENTTCVLTHGVIAMPSSTESSLY